MSSEWPIFPLGDLTINHDGKRKPVKESERKPGPYPYYGASGIVDYVDGYLFDGSYLLIGEDGENMRTRQTPIAFMAQGKFWVNNHAHIVTGNHLADTRFLMYSMLNSDIHSYLTGAVMPKLTQGNLNKILLACPPLDVQYGIVSVLSALDDQITVLREINHTLEAIAQAIFKSWFVDFDPVKAKAAGLVPGGIDAATAALFPDSFDESDFGSVPSGWKIGSFSDFMILHRGTINPANKPSSVFQHFSLPAFDNGQFPVSEIGDSIKSNKTSVPENAVLLSKLNPQIPRVWLPSTVDVNAVCSTEFLPFIPTDHSSTSFIYALLSNPSISRDLSQLVTGTSNSHQRVRPDIVLGLRRSIPSKKIVAAFNAIADPLCEQVKLNREEIRTLLDLRDTLLPRLISGKLKLPETTQKAVEMACMQGS